MSDIYTLFIKRKGENIYELELDNKPITEFDNDILSHFWTLKTVLQNLVSKIHISHRWNSTENPTRVALTYKGYEILSVCQFTTPKEPEEKLFAEFVANEDPLKKALKLFELIQLLIKYINKIEQNLENQNNYKPIIFRIEKIE